MLRALIGSCDRLLYPDWWLISTLILCQHSTYKGYQSFGQSQRSLLQRAPEVLYRETLSRQPSATLSARMQEPGANHHPLCTLIFNG